MMHMVMDIFGVICCLLVIGGGFAFLVFLALFSPICLRELEELEELRDTPMPSSIGDFGDAGSASSGNSYDRRIARRKVERAHKLGTA